MPASSFLRPHSWFVAPGADLTVAAPAIDTATVGTVVSAAVAADNGLPLDAVGYLVGIDADANNVAVAITNLSATTRARSRYVFQRVDRVASRTATISGVTMRRPYHNRDGANITSLALGVDEWVVLEKISGSTEMLIAAGSGVAAAAA